MTNQQQNNNQKENQVSKGIKDTAGAAFQVAHSALETTENTAMNVVDATTNAVNKAAKNVQNMGSNE
ncbi:hypothetical protein D1B31_04765 [Neobacillus notoginsengisoli]|uniref:Uncharacterized protein n=1 Tax=Neobacillus notoginsengisoli TaxID=1578198 RepID=A0A417YX04_9BACI|nr:hypothetical protein [Neobacillus notoginsengisoli]RHW41962.1 hypothetical protein D1B31_04765 [Neobacillus notoginsengisoli]